MEEILISDILCKGCRSRREASMVKRIHLELSEVRRYWDVENFFHDGHQRMYITAKIKKTQKPSLFIPNHVSDSLNLLQMKTFLSMNSDDRFQGIYLAFIQADSTCVISQITEGLLQPKEITSKNLERDKQRIRDTLLKKQRNILGQSAFYQIPVTLNINVEDIRNFQLNED